MHSFLSIIMTTSVSGVMKLLLLTAFLAKSYSIMSFYSLIVPKLTQKFLHKMKSTKKRLLLKHLGRKVKKNVKISKSTGGHK